MWHDLYNASLNYIKYVSIFVSLFKSKVVIAKITNILLNYSLTSTYFFHTESKLDIKSSNIIM